MERFNAKAMSSPCVKAVLQRARVPHAMDYTGENPSAVPSQEAPDSSRRSLRRKMARRPPAEKKLVLLNSQGAWLVAKTRPFVAGPHGALTHFILCGEWISQPSSPALYGWKAGMTSWKALAKPPVQFGVSSSSVLHDGKIVAVGGNLDLDSIAYDIETDVWRKGPTLPGVCFYSSLVVADGDLVVIIRRSVVVFDTIVGKWLVKGSLDLAVVSCSVAAEGHTLLILARGGLEKISTSGPRKVVIDIQESPILQTYNLRTTECHVHCFPRLCLDMDLAETAPRYVGVIQELHCFLAVTGHVFRFRVSDAGVEMHASLFLPDLGIRRMFGTFVDNDELTIIGGKDTSKQSGMWNCPTIATNLHESRVARFPGLPYDTSVWQTFQMSPEFHPAWLPDTMDVPMPDAE